MSLPKTLRALHYVYKIGNRNETTKFFKDILGMKILRHEEFSTGCEATCNGPYDGKWSKTMVGYGPEDSHFVCELTYNYGISTYKQGNSFVGLFIRSRKIVPRARAAGVPMTKVDDHTVLHAPGGYTFHIMEIDPIDDTADPVYKVVLNCKDLSITTKYYRDLLGLLSLNQCIPKVARYFSGENQALLELRETAIPIEHAKAGGRMAYSCPSSLLQDIEERVRVAGGTILTPYLSLDTPGKATVHVVILADPDGHEICFVGDEGFRQLSAVDPSADACLSEAMTEDDSDDWFQSRGGKKTGDSD